MGAASMYVHDKSVLFIHYNNTIKFVEYSVILQNEYNKLKETLCISV